MTYTKQSNKHKNRFSASRAAANNAEGVIYARYSSHAQKDASIEQQVSGAKEYAKALGIRIVEVYADRAISGKTDRRADFQRMMRDARKSKFQYVIAWKSNRMGRNMLQSMMHEAELQDLGIRVLYTEESFDDTAAGRFALRSMMNVNQFYSENMAEDIRRGLRDNATNCMITNGSIPFGYKKGEDMKYAIDEPKDTIVREIYTRVACEEAFISIANDLNDRGIKTSRGNDWNKNSFHALLSNERYTGVYIYDDIRIEGGTPQIVSKEMFWKVQEVLKMKKNPQGRLRASNDYLLTGKLFCGHCQSPMVGISGTGKSGKPHFYYACQTRRLQKACKKGNVRRDELETNIAKAIKEYALKDDVINWIADSTVAYNKKQIEQSHISLLKDELAQTKRAIQNLMAAVEQGIITDTTKSRLMELEGSQANLVAKIAAEQANIILVPRDKIVEGLKIFRTGDISNKRYQAKLFDTFLVAVYLYDDHLKIVFTFTGQKNTIDLPLDSLLSESGEECSYALSLEPP